MARTPKIIRKTMRWQYGRFHRPTAKQCRYFWLLDHPTLRIR